MKHKRNYPKAFAKAFKNHCEMAVLTGKIINIKIKKLTHFIGSYFISYEKLADQICLPQIAEDIDLEKLAECYDIESIAGCIDAEEIAGHVEICDVASFMNPEDIASYLDDDYIASFIDVDPSVVAKYVSIDYDEIEVCYSDIIDELELEDLAYFIVNDKLACQKIADRVNAKVIASHVQDPWSMMVTPFEKEH